MCRRKKKKVTHNQKKNLSIQISLEYKDISKQRLENSYYKLFTDLKKTRNIVKRCKTKKKGVLEIKYSI